MGSRRDRYEAANIRGGMGVRKKLAEQSLRTTYRLNGVQRGATIAECLDKYGRWELGHRLGVLVRQTPNWVHIKWDDEDEVDQVTQGDARYLVDRGKWRITNPRLGSPLEQRRGESLIALAQKESKQDSDPALTGHSATDRFTHRQNADSTDRGDDEDMDKVSNAAAERAAAKKALEEGSLAERETYTAKQVATRCGTDAKTMRKFFRSTYSTVEPVGQGGRYEFAATDLPKIKEEYDAWSNKGTKKAPTPKKRVEKIDRGTIEAVAQKVVEEDDSDDFTMEQVADAIERAQEQEVYEAVRDHFGDDHEPTAEELEEMAKLISIDDLDIDDLDAEEI